MNLVNRFLIIAASLLIAACGGDGLSSISTSEVSGINVSSTCNVTNTSSANEPLFDYIWHIKNTNQYFASTNPAAGSGVDLCMGNLWASGINGNGVKINVVDSGLEIAHEDLVDRIITGASYNFLNGSTDPTSTDTTGDHGTSVAGLIAATSGNRKGGAGVAPQAGLMGYNLIASTSTQNITNTQISFGANPAYQSKSADIFNNSNGNVMTQLVAPNTSRDSILMNLTTLRAGKGAIHIKSAGNNFTGWDEGSYFNGDYTLCKEAGISCQNANQDPQNTVYNTIVVGALNADGLKSSYSTTGSALWVSGFGGEYGYDVAVNDSPPLAFAYKPAMLTTDQSTCGIGYSRDGVTKNRLDKGDGSGLDNASCNYTAGFAGTSSAAPTVSGVIALMLQANPNLTWRDVRHILASTSRRVNPSSAAIRAETLTLEQGWVKNGAGFWYHNWYGFGLVNAAAAVAKAQSYTAGSLGTFTSQEFIAVLGDVIIPSGGLDGLSKVFLVAGPTTIEQAELTLYFNDSYIPLCTQIELSSPSGTKSILLNMGSAHLVAATTGVRFLSNAFYGESAAGTWTLRFIKEEDATCNSSNLSSTSRQALTIRGRN